MKQSMPFHTKINLSKALDTATSLLHCWANGWTKSYDKLRSDAVQTAIMIWQSWQRFMTKQTMSSSIHSYH